MRFSLSGMIRLVGILAVVAGSVAVAMARLEPAPTHFRMATPPHYGVINGFVLEASPDFPRFVDAETGVIRRFALPKGDQLEFVSCSPWQDEQGEFQVVGRWLHQRDGEESRQLFESFGLARYALPSGRMLNCVPLEILPSSHPCWFPGNSARILYAGGDGLLYRLDFDDRSAGGEVKAQQVRWACEAPGDLMAMKDPVWSQESRPGGRVIVSMQYRTHGSDPKLSPARLWWLSLSDDGNTIVAGGLLTDPSVGASHPGAAEERFPNMGVTPAGGLVLAYLWQPAQQSRWELRLAPVTFDATTGAPVVRSEDARTLCDRQIAELTPFSADGRWVYSVVQGERTNSVARFPTAPPRG